MQHKNTEQRNEVPISWFTKTLWQYRSLYAELLLLAFCMRLIGLVEPFIFQVIIDRILPFHGEASLLAVVIVFAAVSLFQIGFNSLSTVLGVRTANAATEELGGRILDHLLKLPLRHFRHWTIGETVARVNETETIRRFLVGITTGALLDLVFVFIYIFVLMALSVQLTLIVIAALPLQVLVYLGFGSPLRSRFREQFDAGASHYNQMVESISGIAAIKSLGAENKILTKLNRTLVRSLQTTYRVTTLQLWSEQLTFALEQAVKITVIFVGAHLAFDGQLTVGELVAFHLLSEKVVDPIGNFSGLWEAWQNIKVSRQRLGDIVNSETEPFSSLPLLPTYNEPRLTFESVTFGYRDDKAILDKFDFSARPNSLTLIVGPSGIGKSTFGRLAAGIEVPSSGKILLGAEDISAYDPHDVRSKIGYVPQEPYLFTGTLRDNLLLGSGEVGDHQLLLAMKAAAAEELVESLPRGLDAHIGQRGAALSGGQRQRVVIARALLKEPRVLVLDEPTSALELAAQRRIVESLEQLKTYTTIIVITHRPDVFPRVDQIVDFSK